ncbi:Translocator protein [Clonorchis sinensis]|uniref:Benzodiazepine receptor n=2 Tax=Clonorchis sinensis TaxID=79923 RepID=G7YQD5_CLOSI|nr:Translocator protein [Clonorchis sinensis]GAA55165.1 benzodiazepine receptor [Clonorchis sinensis]
MVCISDLSLRIPFVGLNSNMFDYRAIPFVVTPLLGSFAGARIVGRNMAWYDTLKLPNFAPPKWVFGPAWTFLYVSMGTASYLVWRDAAPDEANLPLAVYGFHLLANWAWTPVFFGAHQLKESCAVIAAVLGGAIASAVLFRPINQLASNLMLPYIAWLSYASMVNFATAAMN